MKKTKILILSWLLALALILPAHAQMTVFDLEGTAKDHEALSSITTSTGFTSSKVNHATYGPAKAALITVETAGVRVMFHGSDPTTSTGHPMNAGDSFVIRGTANVSQTRFINASAGNGAVVRATFYY